VRTQLLESGFALRAAPGREIAKNSLGFHNPDVGLFGDGDQIIGGISFDESAIAPVVRHADLVHVLSVDEERAHPGSDKGSRLDDPARTEPVGWSYILFGCDPAELPDTSDVRERAVQTWLVDHGIVSASS